MKYALLLLLLSRVAFADEPVPTAPEPQPEPEPAAQPPVATQPPPPANNIPPLATASPPVVLSPFARWPRELFALDLSLVTQARWTQQPGDDLTEVKLDRGELGAVVALAPRALAELRLEAVRSAGEGGALGVDGDSLVVRIKRAQAAGEFDLGSARIDGALGLVQDPWLAVLEQGYPLLPLSRTASERLLGWPVSDLSAEVRAIVGPARLSIAAGNGEGLRYPERNQGKTTTAVLEVVPVNTLGLLIDVAAVARDGSIGPASVRDRRAGGAVTVVASRVRAGIEAVHAWGLAGHGEVTGTVLEGWGALELPARTSVAARGATLGLSGGGRSSTFGGAVAITPWSSPQGALKLWLAIDRQTMSGNAAILPDAGLGDATTIMFIASATGAYLVEPPE